MGNRIWIHLCLWYYPKYALWCLLKKEVVCLFFAFVQDLYYYLFTTSELYLLFKNSIFRVLITPIHQPLHGAERRKNRYVTDTKAEETYCVKKSIKGPCFNASQVKSSKHFLRHWKGFLEVFGEIAKWHKFVPSFFCRRDILMSRNFVNCCFQIAKYFTTH